MNRLLIVVGFLAAAPFCLAASANELQADKDRIKAHLTFLADDLMEGREAGSRGYDIAARYVAAQLSLVGVAPLGDLSPTAKSSPRSFFQAVPLRSTKLDQTSPIFEIRGKSGVQTLKYLDDFTLSSSFSEDVTELTAPLVYVGYGIVAPRFGIDDYAGLDVKGKIVVQLAGSPPSLGSEEGAHYAGGDHKRQMSSSRGAVGTISLQTPLAEKSFAFALARRYAHWVAMTWLDANGNPGREFPSLRQRVGLSLAASQQLLDHAGVKLEDLVQAADAKKPPSRLNFAANVHLAGKTIRANLSSSNVVGVIEGSDPVLKNEYVVFTAHLDGLGMVADKPGDNIFNGAMDNAAGVAVLLESARLLAAQAVKPKRSTIFIALTGEEKGLLGADFFARFPTVPKGTLVANVNLDMPLLTFDFADVIAFGAEHSSMGGAVKRAVEKLGVTLTPDPWPAKRLFVRSDHYMFVRQGVPSIFLVTGIKSMDKNVDASMALDNFLITHYHQFSDDLLLPINYTAAARFAEVNLSIGVEVANASQRPTWNRGNFFGDTFGKGNASP